MCNQPTVMGAARQIVAAAALQVEAPAHQVQDQLEVPTRKAAQAGAEVTELSPRLATVVDLEEEAEADGSEAAAAIMLLAVAARPSLQICYLPQGKLLSEACRRVPGTTRLV